MYDRNNFPLSIRANTRGHYLSRVNSIPDDFKKLLIAKEDKFFYYHLGINPISTVRAFYNYLLTGKAGGSSTLTQQLAKNLLGTESERTILNKITESFYALSIEIFASKEDILLMYTNTAYLGNQVQGFNTASHAYFNKNLDDTTHNEQISLLATLSYPSTRNPWEEDNVLYSEGLSLRISPTEKFIPPAVTKSYSFQSDSYFELKTAGVYCEYSCNTTIDNDVTNTVRSILERNIQEGMSRNIKNGAVVVIDPVNDELIAIVGSPNPNSNANGSQINMAIEPRPIGSTVKPFIYTKGFMSGLRPYTLVEDREYKFPIATGFSLYPKNYDGQYRGEVTLHEALSNSLNVPSVKVLEFIGLENFYNFLSNSLKFQPIQDYDSYQYGIALGGLEMDLLTLTHYFTIFPAQGYIAPLNVLSDHSDNFQLPPQSNVTKRDKVAGEEYIELVHAIISDRFTGVNQFGLESNLNLSGVEYGVKTGTSRDFHDSWVVGYTPDYVVGVWIGNSENEPLQQVSGQSGAGSVWNEVMQYLSTTKYNHSSKFNPRHLERFQINNSDEWGVSGDIVSEHRNLIDSNDIILSIHEGDTFAIEDNTSIPLRAKKSVLWKINGDDYAEGKETTFHPTNTGNFAVSAYDPETNETEIVYIKITEPE